MMEPIKVSTLAEQCGVSPQAINKYIRTNDLTDEIVRIKGAHFVPESVAKDIRQHYLGTTETVETTQETVETPVETTENGSETVETSSETVETNPETTETNAETLTFALFEYIKDESAKKDLRIAELESKLESALAEQAKLQNSVVWLKTKSGLSLPGEIAPESVEVVQESEEIEPAATVETETKPEQKPRKLTWKERLFGWIDND